jgi:DNA topoisomerase-1
LKWGKFGSFFACSTYNKKDPNSCTFTKENFAAKPEMNTQEGEERSRRKNTAKPAAGSWC